MAGDHEIKDTSGLTDADWAAINKLRRAYDGGGDEALRGLTRTYARGTRSLGPSYGRVFSDYVREKLKDAMADLGMTIEDLRDMIRKSELPSSSKH